MLISAMVLSNERFGPNHSASPFCFDGETPYTNQDPTLHWVFKILKLWHKRSLQNWVLESTLLKQEKHNTLKTTLPDNSLRSFWEGSDLQRLGIERSRLESPGVNKDVLIKI